MDTLRLVPKERAGKKEERESAVKMIDGMLKDIEECGVSSISAVLVMPDGSYKIYTSLTNNHLMTIGALVECISQRQHISDGK